MDFNEQLLRAVAQKVLGTLQVPYGEHVVDLAQPFARLTITDAIRRHHPHFSTHDLANRDLLVRELAKAGVFIQSDENQRANPNYLCTKFNELRPELIAEATRNARAVAGQFAGETGSRVGAIRSANQGVIQIFGSDGNDESGAYHPTSTVTKQLRVVSTVEFELTN